MAFGGFQKGPFQPAYQQVSGDAFQCDAFQADAFQNNCQPAAPAVRPPGGGGKKFRLTYRQFRRFRRKYEELLRKHTDLEVKHVPLDEALPPVYRLPLDELVMAYKQQFGGFDLAMAYLQAELHLYTEREEEDILMILFTEVL